MPKPTAESDTFYNTIIFPFLRKIEKAARDEVEFRIEDVCAVRTTTERAAVIQLRNQIDAGPAAIGGVGEFLTQMIDVIAEEGGHRPPLARVDAAQAIGELIRNKSLVSIPETQADRLIEAARTDPFLRGGTILWGALQAAAGETPDLATRWSERIAETEAAPKSDSPDETNRVTRLALIDAAARHFASLKDQRLPMILPEWRVIGHDLPITIGSDIPGAKKPKCVIKLGPREILVQSLNESEGGKQKLVQGWRLCSPELQTVAAGVGVPYSGDYEAVALEDRNLTMIVGEPRLAMEQPGEAGRHRWRGIRIPPLDVLSFDEADLIRETMAKSDAEKGVGNLTLVNALAMLRPDALTAIIATRVSRYLHHHFNSPGRRREMVRRRVNAELTRLASPVEVQTWQGDEMTNTATTSILASHVEEFNSRGPGRLRQIEVTETQARDSLEIAVLGSLCTISPDHVPVTRGETEICRLVTRLVREKGLSPADLQQFPSLGTRGEIKTETIRREGSALRHLPTTVTRPKDRGQFE